MKDFYYILGTDVNCTPNEIREAYRKLSKKFHPDLNQNDAYFTSRFREIQEAYETLINPARRSKYDAALKRSRPYQPGPAPIKQRAHSRTKGIDIAFTITLLVIILIFGGYVYRSMTGTKTITANKITATAQAAGTINHHKKKHKLKGTQVVGKPAARPVVIATVKTQHTKAIADTINTRQVKQPVVAHTTRHDDPAPVNSASYRGPGMNANAPYQAYIKSNATGVVYLRKADAYNSDVVEAIPSNSKVEVLEKGKVFCKVSFNNKTGYVPNWTVPAR